MQRILLVDSDQETLRLTAKELTETQNAAIAEILSRAKHVVNIPDGWLEYKLFTADHLEDARQILDDEEITMVFVDPMMPQMEGMQLVLHMQRAYPKIPVVMFTDFLPTFADNEMRAHVLRHYIERPYNVGVIQLRIFEILLINVLDPEFPIEHGANLASLLQLIRNGNQACTVRMQNDTQSGYISFLPGNLVDAACGDLRGEEAILELLTLENPTIGILPDSMSQKDLIKTTLPQILSVHFESIEDRLPEKEPRNIRKLKEFLQYLLAGIDRHDPKRRLPSLLGALKGLTSHEPKPKKPAVIAPKKNNLLEQLQRRSDCRYACLTDATGGIVSGEGDEEALDSESCRMADMLWLFGKRITGKQKNHHIVVAGEDSTFIVAGLKAPDGQAHYLLAVLDPNAALDEISKIIKQQLPDLASLIVDEPEAE